MALRFPTAGRLLAGALLGAAVWPLLSAGFPFLPLPVRFLIASTKQLPDAAVYPDSGKVGLWTGNESDPPRLFRLGDAVDYWDGET